VDGRCDTAEVRFAYRKRVQMSKTLTIGAVSLFFVIIVAGLWDLFRGLNALAASVALIFAVVGVFNTWGALNEANRR
jgi:exosortase/archaeosortase